MSVTILKLNVYSAGLLCESTVYCKLFIPVDYSIQCTSIHYTTVYSSVYINLGLYCQCGVYFNTMHVFLSTIAHYKGDIVQVMVCADVT